MENQINKVATAFHESFALSLPSISQILEVACKTQTDDSAARGKKLTYNDIKDGTTLGNNYVKAMRRYTRAVGLFGKQDCLTRFGELVSQRDPFLRNNRTLWAMHYHLCALHQSGPKFWGYLVSECFTPYRELTAEEVAQLIAAYLESNGESVLAPRTLKTTATIFLGSYYKSDGLGPLGILTNGDDGKYTVEEPMLADTRVVAYVIADYWHAVWGNRKSANLSAMTEPGGPASLLLMSSGDMNSCLSDMAGLGLVEVQRRVHPYSVVRLWDNPDEVLEHLYDD